jgi:hypothetical protein
LPAFKAKVALAAIKGDRTIAQLAVPKRSPKTGAAAQLILSALDGSSSEREVVTEVTLTDN